MHATVLEVPQKVTSRIGTLTLNDGVIIKLPIVSNVYVKPFVTDSKPSINHIFFVRCENASAMQVITMELKESSVIWWWLCL